MVVMGTVESLTAEVGELRARLAAAEELQRAIRQGDVDAVVIARSGGDVVYTLHGADRMYRQLIETMSEGALTLSASGLVLYGNLAVSRMLGRPLDRIVGTALRDYLPAGDQHALEHILISSAAAPTRLEMTLVGGDGRELPVLASFARLPAEGSALAFCVVLTDLTQQRFSARLVQDERLARSILEEAAEAIVVTDEHGFVIRANRVALGLSSALPLPRPFAEMFPLRTSTPAAFDLAAVLRGETVRLVDAVIDRDGTDVNLIVNGGPLRGDGAILGAVVTLTDITKRWQALQELRLSEERFRAVFEHAADVMFLLEVPPVGTPVIRDANSAASTLLGYDRTELIGRPVSMIESRSAELDEVEVRRRAAIAEAGGRFELTHRCKDGSTRQFEVSVSELTLGPQAYALAIERDITDRRLAEESMARLATAVEQSAESIVVVDLKGDIQYVNPTFESLTGYSRTEAIGQNPRLLKSGVHDAAFYETMWATLLRGESWSGHLVNKKKDGTLFEEEATISPVRDGAGRTINYVAVKRDVSRELQLEREIRQSQKIEAIGQLAGGVAHDFNNILAAMLIQVELTSRLDGLPASALSGLRDIGASAERAANLTRQLLLFSRRQVMQPRALDLNVVVTSIANMLQRIIGEETQLQINLHPHPLNTWADAGMIDQVLMNLVVNARDAMPGGGKIVISTGEAIVATEEMAARRDVEQGRYVTLRVCDSGVGISPSQAQHIFEPFYTTKTEGKGTGLGLATAFGIAKQHKGTIFFERNEVRGTAFELLLPANEPTAEAAGVPEAPKPPAGGTETILLVEDEAAVRTLMVIVLESAGYRVLEASDGIDALRQFEEQAGSIDLLFTDIVMPAGVGGRELARQLQERKPSLRVILTSGYSADSAGAELVLGARQRFLPKPSSMDEILATVRRSLDE
ncbi:MAG: PAS domain S-box protein [Gemmatimonadetes bacterium]|nr:PAS domain S-box protein [Gemmatimonadota bacterium]